MVNATRHRRALVTGGLGFIGSTLTERLLARGMEVTVVDNELSNVISAKDLASVYPRIRYIKADIAEYLRAEGGALRCDLVIHAASYVGAAGVLQYAGRIARDMVDATHQVIAFCLRNDADLINISSSEVYGRSGVLAEHDDIRVPPYFNARIEYALAKLAGEAMIRNSRPRGLRALSIRPFNVAGPRQSGAGGFVLPTFVQQALANQRLTVFGDGLQTRSFVGVDDVADFVELCLERPCGAPCVVNLGNPDNTTTIRDLAHRVRHALGSRAYVAHIDPRSIYGPEYCEAESVEKVCDISVARAMGWSPRAGLTDIILDTAAYYGVRCGERGSNAGDGRNRIGADRVAAWR